MAYWRTRFFGAAGGGSLLAGIAAWYANTNTQVIGVEPETACAIGQALKIGQPIDVEVSGIAVDSLGARRVGQQTFPVIREYVADMLTVTDDWIIQAQRELWQQLRLIAEPGGAVALAALLSRRYVPSETEHVAVVISGANTDLNLVPR